VGIEVIENRVGAGVIGGSYISNRCVASFSKPWQRILNKSLGQGLLMLGRITGSQEQAGNALS
jgi:hypothetical protein